MGCPAFLPLVLIIGLYFIAEHGIMNWLVSYATNALEVPMGQAANFTAVFFRLCDGGASGAEQSGG